MFDRNRKIAETIHSAAGRYVLGPRRSFVNVLDNISHPVLLTTAELDKPGPKILHANPAFLRICGYELSDVLGKTPRIFHGPETDPKVVGAFKQALRSQGHGETTVVNYDRRGATYRVAITARRLAAEPPFEDVYIATMQRLAD